jgi:hypothetical protein
MKTFKGSKRLDVILRQCREQKVHVDRRQFDRGADHIVLEKGGAQVFYNVFNGRFFGAVMIDGSLVKFNSDASVFDKKPWFQALLDFFYTDDPAEMTSLPMSSVAATAGGIRNAR